MNTKNLNMDIHQSSAPRRRWYQFSLRTMFVLVFVASIPMAWVGYSLNWIKQRQGWDRAEGWVLNGETQLRYEITDLHVDPPAPSFLWLFGEAGTSIVICEESKVKEASRLFPEAKIIGLKNHAPE